MASVSKVISKGVYRIRNLQDDGGSGKIYMQANVTNPNNRYIEVKAVDTFNPKQKVRRARMLLRTIG